MQDHGLLSIDKHREKFLRYLSEDCREAVKFRWSKVDPKGDRSVVGMELWTIF